MGNQVKIRLCEIKRGETAGVVRLIEVRHANSGQSSTVSGERVLASGQPASFFVPDHLVTIKAKLQGPVATSGSLSLKDEVVLHVPVRGYLRFLPGIFQGEGPVGARMLARKRDNALQRWGSGLPEEVGVDVDMNEDPMRRFLFIFQTMMTTLTDEIDDVVRLTDPLQVDPKFLVWLASWVSFQLDESLPIQQQRELVRRATRLYRSRGTKTGIQEMVRILTTAPVRIKERKPPKAAVVGQCVLIGGRDVVERYERDNPPGHYLMDAASRKKTSFFTLNLETRQRFRSRFGGRAAGVLRRIVQVASQERPQHIAYTIEMDHK